MKKAATIWFCLTVLIASVGWMEGQFPGPITNVLLPLWTMATAATICLAVVSLFRRGKPAA